jgi:hypothetical protein
VLNLATAEDEPTQRQVKGHSRLSRLITDMQLKKTPRIAALVRLCASTMYQSFCLRVFRSHPLPLSLFPPSDLNSLIDFLAKLPGNTFAPPALLVQQIKAQVDGHLTLSKSKSLSTLFPFQTKTNRYRNPIYSICLSPRRTEGPSTSPSSRVRIALDRMI